MKYYLQAIGLLLAAIATLSAVAFAGWFVIVKVLLPLYLMYEHWALLNMPKWALVFGPFGILLAMVWLLGMVIWLVNSIANDLKEWDRQQRIEEFEFESDLNRVGQTIDKKTKKPRNMSPTESALRRS